MWKLTRPDKQHDRLTRDNLLDLEDHHLVRIESVQQDQRQVWVLTNEEMARRRRCWSRRTYVSRCCAGRSTTRSRAGRSVPATTTMPWWSPRRPPHSTAQASVTGFGTTEPSYGPFAAA
ncbi:hypothetical protein [Streptomyces sp. NRRL S-340]|uniref:hypothetical protein n=1 Tax=Streptomyces sp. NRRL S-340 TaxID=1463901 RepID=UPI001F2CBE2E|nr:hypothetical protein [Streptomyces sp. NRRL S-340]